uniref:Uncharacterized protein n=1 Tax=Arundo donax TaxID=35708 RepID=A0A0A8YG40_ARUDO
MSELYLFIPFKIGRILTLTSIRRFTKFRSTSAISFTIFMLIWCLS